MPLEAVGALTGGVGSVLAGRERTRGGGGRRFVLRGGVCGGGRIIGRRGRGAQTEGSAEVTGQTGRAFGSRGTLRGTVGARAPVIASPLAWCVAIPARRSVVSGGLRSSVRTLIVRATRVRRPVPVSTGGPGRAVPGTILARPVAGPAAAGVFPAWTVRSRRTGIGTTIVGPGIPTRAVRALCSTLGPSIVGPGIPTGTVALSGGPAIVGPGIPARAVALSPIGRASGRTVTVGAIRGRRTLLPTAVVTAAAVAVPGSIALTLRTGIVVARAVGPFAGTIGR